MKNHILICGAVGTGKSTLARRLLALAGSPVSGFLTKRLPPDKDGECLTYIHPAALSESERSYSKRNLIGSCSNRHLTYCVPEAFDNYGVELLKKVPETIIVMDEIGFMENKALFFQKAILCCLDGQQPVLGVIKSKQTPFLDSVRAHPNVSVYDLTEENRDALYEELSSKIQEIWGL